MIRTILQIAIPTMVSTIFSKLTEIINLIYAGHLNDPAKLAGVGLANMTLNVFG